MSRLEVGDRAALSQRVLRTLPASVIVLSSAETLAVSSPNDAWFMLPRKIRLTELGEAWMRRAIARTPVPRARSSLTWRSRFRSKILGTLSSTVQVLHTG